MLKFILFFLLLITHLSAISIFDTPKPQLKWSGVDECPIKIYEADQDRDGVSDRLDKCPNTPCDLIVNYEGCPNGVDSNLDIDRDGVLNYFDKCPNTIRGFLVNSEGCPLSISTSILFRIFSNKISKHSIDDIINFSKSLNRNYTAQIIIKPNRYYKYGEKYNDTLLNKRIDSLIYIFQILGISQNRIYIDNVLPQESNSSKEILEKNREIYLSINYINSSEDDIDRDGILDSLDNCLDTPRGVEVDDFGCSIDITATIHFKSNSSKLANYSINILKNLADYIIENSIDEFYIRGYCDTQESNPIDLSYQRAKVVKDKLIEFGVKSYNITLLYYGNKYPIKENITPRDRAINRRVEIKSRYNNSTNEYWKTYLDRFNKFIIDNSQKDI